MLKDQCSEVYIDFMFTIILEGYKYTLNIVDVASRYKGSYQLATKNSKDVAQAFQWKNENTP